MVALRKESVDRNLDAMQIVIVIVWSLSARRAWIEIALPSIAGYFLESLSARRAWIEIILFVNLRVVDGSSYPQGERG